MDTFLKSDQELSAFGKVRERAPQNFAVEWSCCTVDLLSQMCGVKHIGNNVRADV